MGHIHAYLTASAVRHYGPGINDYQEERGWIDSDWSRTQLHESREDVPPLVDCDDSDEDLAEYVSDVLGDLSMWDDVGGGSFASHEERNEDGTSYTYTVHFARTYLGSDGWVEEAWHPVTDGGINLKRTAA